MGTAATGIDEKPLLSFISQCGVDNKHWNLNFGICGQIWESTLTIRSLCMSPELNRLLSALKSG